MKIAFGLHGIVGGVDGKMTAEVAVNYVTTVFDSGKDHQVGRVIIGQIHGKDDEPIRLYYRKLPNNDKGSIYYAHEELGDNDEFWIEMIGSRSNSADNPDDGIELNERFSYAIEVAGNELRVTVMRPGKPDVVSFTDMSDSGYAEEDDYMYFKAGVYNQNNSENDEGVQATFYSIENSHQGYADSEHAEFLAD